MESERISASPFVLLRQAAGPPRAFAGKVRRLAAVLAGYADGRVLEQRLARLREAGFIDDVPSRLQIVVGSIDMLRFWISPAAADYYRQKGLDFTFHQILRILEEPASMADPVGFFSSRDGIIGHLMQVVHANPVYDLQLLGMFPDGLDELERQLGQMRDGTHPRAASIRAIVEEGDYHARLHDFVRKWRKDPQSPPLLRSNVAEGAFSEIEKTFGTLPAAMRYFRRLPRTPLGAARHLLGVTTFPRHLTDG
jgi:hypothetical protein